MTTYHATKYDSAAHEVIAYLADETEGYGERDYSAGNVDAPTGWFALVTIPADVDFTGDPTWNSADGVATEYGVTADDVTGHHLVTHNSQGFVSVESFATREEASEEFACRAARFAEWSDAEEAMDTDPEDDGFRIYVCPVTGHGYHEV